MPRLSLSVLVSASWLQSQLDGSRDLALDNDGEVRMAASDVLDLEHRCRIRPNTPHEIGIVY